jgi:hypothetical protein
MFVLCELRNRAETVDTILLYASNKKEVLEKIKAEIFNNLWEKEEQWAEKNDYPTTSTLKEWCQERMKNHHIIEVPYVED